MDMRYRFFVTSDGTPLRLWMMGANLYSGGHKDEYVAYFYDYEPTELSDDDFVTPGGGSRRGGGVRAWGVHASCTWSTRALPCPPCAVVYVPLPPPLYPPPTPRHALH